MPLARSLGEGEEHIHNGILLSIRKGEILPFVTAWMDLENIKLSEISQTEKVNNHVISLKCGYTTESTKQTNEKRNKTH